MQDFLHPPYEAGARGFKAWGSIGIQDCDPKAK